jgi:hypothetical protein
MKTDATPIWRRLDSGNTFIAGLCKRAGTPSYAGTETFMISDVISSDRVQGTKVYNAAGKGMVYARSKESS